MAFSVLLLKISGVKRVLATTTRKPARITPLAYGDNAYGGRQA
jgi:hypothetical protein